MCVLPNSLKSLHFFRVKVLFSLKPLNLDITQVKFSLLNFYINPFYHLSMGKQYLILIAYGIHIISWKGDFVTDEVEMWLLYCRLKKGIFSYIYHIFCRKTKIIFTLLMNKAHIYLLKVQVFDLYLSCSFSQTLYCFPICIQINI